MEDFFLVLPSNVIDPENPDNKTSDYTTTLPNILQLEDTWEVALVEIHLPHSWYNLYNETDYVTLGIRVRRNKYRFRKYVFRDGYYTAEKVSLLLTEFARDTLGEDNPTKFEYDHISRRFEVTLCPLSRIQFSNNLARLFAFATSGFNNNSPSRVASFAGGTVLLNLQQVFIYTSCIKESVIGNQYSNLLRIVFPNNEPGTYFCKVFTHPHYHEVNSEYLNYIRITLRDNQGQLIRFESGDVICKLHFRKKKNSVLL